MAKASEPSRRTPPQCYEPRDPRLRQQRARVEHEQKQLNLKLIRDEFRRLAIHYQPLCHERFVSLIHVSPEGWAAFREAHAKTESWEKWHGGNDDDGEWIGRFFGHAEGFDEFSRLCCALSKVLPEIDCNEPVTAWLALLHELAEKSPTPLLRAQQSVWNWSVSDGEPADNFLKLIEMHCETSSPDAEYPRHPLRYVLEFNLFTSSIAAIEILLNLGTLYLPTAFQVTDSHYVPIPLLDLQWADETAFVSAETQEKTSIPNNVVALLESGPDYLFRKIGENWILRFRFGDGKEDVEVGSFSEGYPRLRKGFFHYQKVMREQAKTLLFLDIDPPDSRG